MGISNFVSLLPSLWLCFSLFTLLFLTNFSFPVASISTTTAGGYDGGQTNGNSSSIASSSNPPTTPLAPPPQPFFQSKGSAFRPSIAVIVGVLTTIFSVTFLLLLYAKHCRRGASNFRGGYPPVTARKNSGIDRAVIESLPVFRFASLRGQKDGLECAVCLNKFEPIEVLRLLPKCKHAFHVECVDTWLDAHSTCPLCRYRVDPEDILLVEDNRILYQSETPSSSSSKSSSAMNQPTPELGTISRVSGRHSFAGNSLEVIVETPKPDTTPFVQRRSLDSWNYARKKRKSTETVAVGCFDRPRKDELLLAEKTSASASRLEHRIIISGAMENEKVGPNHRWSDVQPSDLLYLRSEMILSDSCRLSGSRESRPSYSSAVGGGEINGGKNNSNRGGAGRNAINTRSVSEITGMSRFSRSNEDEDEDEDEHQHHHQLQPGRQLRQQRQEEQRKRQAGAVSRWLAWISQSQKQQQQQQQQQQPAVHRTSSSSSVVV